MSAQGWQPIETVRVGATVTVWLEELDGTGFAMTGTVQGNDPVLCLIEDDGGIYWPHENGCCPSHWIDAPVTEALPPVPSHSLGQG
jgi:hypothetical protein